MMNRWLKGVAIAALTAVGTMAAQAADLPTRKEAPAPVFIESVRRRDDNSRGKVQNVGGDSSAVNRRVPGSNPG